MNRFPHIAAAVYDAYNLTLASVPSPCGDKRCRLCTDLTAWMSR